MLRLRVNRSIRVLVRATRAYAAGFGTAGSLLAGAAVLFLLVAAVVGFRGWPTSRAGVSPIHIVVGRRPPAGSAVAGRLRALVATGAADTAGAADAAGASARHPRAGAAAGSLSARGRTARPSGGKPGTTGTRPGAPGGGTAGPGSGSTAGSGSGGGSGPGTGPGGSGSGGSGSSGSGSGGSGSGGRPASDLLGKAKQVVQKVAGKVGGTVSETGGTVSQTGRTLGGAVSQTGDSAGTTVSGVTGQVGGSLPGGGAVSKVGSAAGSTVSNVGGAAGSTVSKVGSAAGVTVSKVGGLGAAPGCLGRRSDQRGRRSAAPAESSATVGLVSGAGRFRGDGRERWCGAHVPGFDGPPPATPATAWPVTWSSLTVGRWEAPPPPRTDRPKIWPMGPMSGRWSRSTGPATSGERPGGASRSGQSVWFDDRGPTRRLMGSACGCTARRGA